MNLYKVTIDKIQTGFHPPVTSFITIANNIGEAEKIILNKFKESDKVTVTSASVLKENYHFSDMDYYVENEKNKL